MHAHTQELLQALRMELAFLERGGYRTPSTRWRPQFIFEDSPICLNSGDPTRSKPCTDCTLMQFVPPDLRGLKYPCRHIPLNEQGETVDSFYRYGTQQELEEALGHWLRAQIQKLEEEPYTEENPPTELRKEASSSRS